ncbi:MAG: hypothetical protein AAGO57_05580 [Pseudomonadota bacterium]
MRIWTLLAVACVLPGMALADMQCRFDSECIAGEACVETAFDLTIETALIPGTLAAEGGFPTDDRIVTDAETIAVTWDGAGPALAAFGSTGSAFHLISIAPDGSARYSAHLPGPFTLTYLGRCE